MENFLFRLIACFAMGFVIGIERQSRHRSLGLRTTILVCLGSFLYVSVSFLISPEEIKDTTRIAAQVVAGIGFLGAGVILKDGLKVRGLTTAATLWCDGAIGVLCASGLVKEALFGTIAIILTNTILRYINIIVNKRYSNKIVENIYEVNIVVQPKYIMNIKDDINRFIEKHKKLDIVLQSLTVQKQDKDECIEFSIMLPKVVDLSFSKLMDSIYEKYEVKSLSTEKVKELINEDEEEAM